MACSALKEIVSMPDSLMESSKFFGKTNFFFETFNPSSQMEAALAKSSFEVSQRAKRALGIILSGVCSHQRSV